MTLTSTGFTNCGSETGSTWSSLTNVRTENDTGTADSISKNSSSGLLYTYNYGFEIPGSATIKGIEFKIREKSGGSGSAVDSTIYVMSNSSTRESSNEAETGSWPSSWTTYSYGGSTDLMGWTDITPSDVNASSFGIEIRVNNPSSFSSETAYVDMIQVNIHYEYSEGNLLNMGAF